MVAKFPEIDDDTRNTLIIGGGVIGLVLLSMYLRKRSKNKKLKYSAPKVPKISKAKMKKLIECIKYVDPPNGWTKKWEKNVTPKMVKAFEAGDWISSIPSLGLSKLAKKKAMPNLERLEDEQLEEIFDRTGEIVGKLVTVFGIWKSNDFDVEKTVSNINEFEKGDIAEDDLIRFEVDWDKVNWQKLVISGIFFADDIAGIAGSVAIAPVIIALATDIPAAIILMQEMDKAIKVKKD